MRTLPYLLTFFLPASVVAGYLLGGWWTFLTPLQGYLLLPLLDHLVGVSDANVPAHREGAAADRVFSRALTAVAVPAHMALVVWAGSKIASGHLSAVETVGLTVSVALASGTATAAAHELLHHGKLERGLAQMLMTLLTYPHFGLEHVQGHHVRAGIPGDPGTARRGEGLYRFVLRAVVDGTTNTYRRELAERRRCGRSALGPRNRLVPYALLTAALYAVLGVFWGWAGLLFLFAQAAISIFLIESINYLEHYGLQRRETALGRHEPFGLEHAWDSSYRLSNWVLFNLGRHSDHHLHGGRRYPVLRHADDGLHHPTGYVGMLLLALVPPLWRRIMDPRAQAVADRAQGGLVPR